MEYKLNWDALAQKLGRFTGEPVPLTGGHLHRMYAVETDSGRFAVKALNPGVMARAEAKGNFLRSEEFARLAEEKEIPALPALLWDGSPLVETDGQFWLIFPWSDGVPRYAEEITPEMCRRMGGILARIHRLTEPFLSPGEQEVDFPDWKRYLALAREQDAPWKDAVSLAQLNEWSGRWSRFRRSPQVCTVSHRDYEPKNTLWCGEDALLIDWEAAGEVSMAADVLEGARNWSKIGLHTDSGRYEAFRDGYREEAGESRWRELDFASAEDARYGFVEWLAYNMKRSLGLEAADEAEKRLGDEQVALTLAENRERQE